MKKPSFNDIVAMSTTPEGALRATKMKWQWILKASKKEILLESFPLCGLCVYDDAVSGDDKGCLHCVLGTCNPEHGDVMKALYKLKTGKISFFAFHIPVRAMLERIESCE